MNRNFVFLLFLFLTPVTSMAIGNPTTDLKSEIVVSPGDLLVRVSPNPFSDKVEFRFNLPESGMTTLKVLDVQGKVLKTILSTNLNSGEHTVEWNGDGLPSGVYFYQLKSDDGVLTGKLIRR